MRHAQCVEMLNARWPGFAYRRSGEAKSKMTWPRNASGAVSLWTQDVRSLVTVAMRSDDQAPARGSDPLADGSTWRVGVVASPIVATPVVIAPSVARTHAGAKGSYLNPGTSRTRAQKDLRRGRRRGCQRSRCRRSKKKCFHCSTPF